MALTVSVLKCKIMPSNLDKFLSLDRQGSYLGSSMLSERDPRDILLNAKADAPTTTPSAAPARSAATNILGTDFSTTDTIQNVTPATIPAVTQNVTPAATGEKQQITPQNPLGVATDEEGNPLVRRAEKVNRISSSLDTLTDQLSTFDRQSDEYIIKQLAGTPPKFQGQQAQLLKLQKEQARSQLTAQIESLGGEVYSNLPTEAQYSADQIREKFQLSGVQAARLAATDFATKAILQPLLAEFADAPQEEYNSIYNSLFGVIRESPGGGRLRTGGFVTQNQFGTLEVVDQGGLNSFLGEFQEQKEITKANRKRPQASYGSSDNIMDNVIKQYESDAKALSDNAKVVLAAKEDSDNPNPPTDSEVYQARLFLEQANKLEQQAIKVRTERRTGNTNADVTSEERRSRAVELAPELQEFRSIRPTDKALSKQETDARNIRAVELAEKVGVEEFKIVKDTQEMEKILDTLPPDTYAGFEIDGVKTLQPATNLKGKIELLVSNGHATQGPDGLLAVTSSVTPAMMSQVAKINASIKASSMNN